MSGGYQVSRENGNPGLLSHVAANGLKHLARRRQVFQDNACPERYSFEEEPGMMRVGSTFWSAVH